MSSWLYIWWCCFVQKRFHAPCCVSIKQVYFVAIWVTTTSLRISRIAWRAFCSTRLTSRIKRYRKMSGNPVSRIAGFNVWDCVYAPKWYKKVVLMNSLVGDFKCFMCSPKMEWWWNDEAMMKPIDQHFRAQVTQSMGGFSARNFRFIFQSWTCFPNHYRTSCSCNAMLKASMRTNSSVNSLRLWMISSTVSFVSWTSNLRIPMDHKGRPKIPSTMKVPPLGT